MASAPQGWSWEEYEDYLDTEWLTALNQHRANEQRIHRFLEAHPCLLPGGEGGMNTIGGHHGPFPGAVISQPQLPGTQNLIPDFLWLTKMSSVFSPVLIEIKRPDKKWFTQNGQQTADLTQAITQVGKLRAWFEYEANKLTFYDRFGISDSIRAYHAVKPVFTLIYGRRSDFSQSATLSRQREFNRPDWLEWSTFDRLRPNAIARNWVTVKIKSGQWSVTSIPPTFEIKSDWKLDLQNLTGLNTAIEENQFISSARKVFLLDQIRKHDL